MIISQFLISFFATVGFAFLFKLSKEAIFSAGIVGAVGWCVYFSSSLIFHSVISASFLGALTVGILGEIFARIEKKPATLFIIPGIIPLVPGGGLYYTMLYLIEKDFSKAATKGVESFFIAAAIAIGIIISSTMSKSIRRFKNKS